MHKSMTAVLLLLCSVTALANSPKIVAHRGGTADAPENTIYAIDQALKNGADKIWITLQLSSDKVPVLYRPSDLNTLTNRSGPVSSYSAQQLIKADAGYRFGSRHNHLYCNKGIVIPTLKQVLQQFPATDFYIDLKSPDADPYEQAKAIEKVLKEKKAFRRTRFYSTNQAFLNALSDHVQRFESRDETRDILANITMNHHCLIDKKVNTQRWYGLELRRKVEVVEKYTLGEARSSSDLVWDHEAMKCFRASGGAHIVLFGIKDEADYKLAKELGADEVMVDSPKYFKDIR